MVAYSFFAAAAALVPAIAARRHGHNHGHKHARHMPDTCPNTPTIIHIQPVVVELHKPLLITGHLPEPTALDCGDGTTFVFPNAPTDVYEILTKTVFDTTTITSTITPAVYTTLPGAWTGTETYTVTLPPKCDTPGIVIVHTPASPPAGSTSKPPGPPASSWTVPPGGSSSASTPPGPPGSSTTCSTGYVPPGSSSSTIPPGGSSSTFGSSSTGSSTTSSGSSSTGSSTTSSGSSSTGSSTTSSGSSSSTTGSSTTSGSSSSTTGSSTTSGSSSSTTGSSTTSGSSSSSSSSSTTSTTTTSGGHIGGSTTTSSTSSKSTCTSSTSTSTSCTKTTTTSTSCTKTTSTSSSCTKTTSTSSSCTKTTSTKPPCEKCAHKPTPTPKPAPVCAPALPKACQDLNDKTALALVPAVPLCLLSLGVYGVGNAAGCLSKSLVTLDLKGNVIVDCLNAVFRDTCISALPNSCGRLTQANGLDLLPEVAKCTLDLGPFATGSAMTCLSKANISASSSGKGVVDCLNKNLLGAA